MSLPDGAGLSVCGMAHAIRIEGTPPKWCVFPCQGSAVDCRVPLTRHNNARGDPVDMDIWALMSGDGLPITLSPSIDCKVCGFHGHIRDGQIETITPGSEAKRDRAVYGDDFE